MTLTKLLIAFPEKTLIFSEKGRLNSYKKLGIKVNKRIPMKTA